MKANGFDRSAGRVNGHATISPCGAPHDMDAAPPGGRAASDDAREYPNAAAATSAAAGTERDAYAEVARPPKGEKRHKPAKKEDGKKDKPRGGSTRRSRNSKSSNGSADHSVGVVEDIPPGAEPLAPDGPSFVDEMHSHVDLYIACARLVKSKDEKISQRMVERLLEMSYGKSPAPPGEEPPPIIFDAPRPLRD